MRIAQAKKERRAKSQAPPKDIVMAMLYLFSRHGKGEVSLSEFQECVAEAQQYFALGYAFSERFVYSLGLLSDLKELHHRGYTRQYNYRHDAFLPKRFLELTALGKGRGSKVLKTLADDEVRSLENAVATAMKNYDDRWRLWSRSKPRDQISEKTEEANAESHTSPEELPIQS